MDLDFGDLRALPEKSLPKHTKERSCSEEKYQCSSPFLVNKKKLIVSLDRERIWGEDPQNTDKYSEILRGLFFEITFAGAENQSPQSLPSGFILYSFSKGFKITFECLQDDPEVLQQWFENFRRVPIPEIGFTKFFNIIKDSPKNGQCRKVLRKEDNHEFCAKIIPGENQWENKKATKQVDVMNKFTGPNVLKVERYFVQKNKSIIITEWIPDTLDDYIPQGQGKKTLTLDQFKNMVFSIMQVIRIMNNSKYGQYGHFSLLKENILMREDKTPVITGFSNTSIANYAGDTQKKPPKKKTKKNLDEDYESIDPRLEKVLEIDSFFIGVIIYEYYAGRPPFRFQDTNVTFEEANVSNVILWEYFDNSQLGKNDTEARKFLRRTLHRERKKRGHITNLLAHPYLQQMFEQERKKIRRKKYPEPEGTPNARRKKTSQETAASKRGKQKGGQIKTKTSIGVDKKKPIQKKTRSSRKNASNPNNGPSIVEVNANQGQNALIFQQHALQIPQNASGYGVGTEARTERYSQGMESEYQQSFSFDESVVDEDNMLHEVQSQMEDQGASIWGDRKKYFQGSDEDVEMDEET